MRYCQFLCRRRTDPLGSLHIYLYSRRFLGKGCYRLTLFAKTNIGDVIYFLNFHLTCVYDAIDISVICITHHVIVKTKHWKDHLFFSPKA